MLGDNSTINVHYGIPRQCNPQCGQQENVKEKSAKNASPRKKYSGILCSDEAEQYWAKLRKGKVVDKDNQPVGLSWSERAHLASVLADRLGIADQWKEFGEYWGLDKETLRSKFYGSTGYGKIKEFYDKINRILS